MLFDRHESDNMNYSVKMYEPIDLVISGTSPLPNPFQAKLECRFETPNGHYMTIPGFYDGEGVWKVRFAPTMEGKWEYMMYSPSIISDSPIHGTIDCVGKLENVIGNIRINDVDRTQFEYSDGTPYYLFAYECDWLWALPLNDGNSDRMNKLLDDIQKVGFNQVLVNTYAHDCFWRQGNTCEDDFGPPAQYLWEGSNDLPRHDIINVNFFKAYDEMMFQLLKRGMSMHIYLKVYNKMVNWPERCSENDDMFFDYIVARYQAFTGVIWDFSKEAFKECDKNYIVNRIQRIRNTDGYNHLVTIHDDHIFADDDNFKRNIDFHTLQEHTAFHKTVLLEKMRTDAPVFNSEFGYECGPKGVDDISYGVGQTPEEFAYRAWQVSIAGGFICYYYTYTAWDIIRVEDTPKGYAYFKILHDFFKNLPWYEYSSKQVSGFYGYGAESKDKGCIFLSKTAKANIQLHNKVMTKVVAMDIYTGESKEADFENNLHSKEIPPEIINPFGERAVVYKIEY